MITLSKEIKKQLIMLKEQLLKSQDKQGGINSVRIQDLDPNVPEQKDRIKLIKKIARSINNRHSNERQMSASVENNPRVWAKGLTAAVAAAASKKKRDHIKNIGSSDEFTAADPMARLQMMSQAVNDYHNESGPSINDGTLSNMRESIEGLEYSKKYNENKILEDILSSAPDYTVNQGQASGGTDSDITSVMNDTISNAGASADSFGSAVGALGGGGNKENPMEGIGIVQDRSISSLASNPKFVDHIRKRYGDNIADVVSSFEPKDFKTAIEKYGDLGDQDQIVTDNPQIVDQIYKEFNGVRNNIKKFIVSKLGFDAGADANERIDKIIDSNIMKGIAEYDSSRAGLKTGRGSNLTTAIANSVNGNVLNEMLQHGGLSPINKRKLDKFMAGSNLENQGAVKVFSQEEIANLQNELNSKQGNTTIKPPSMQSNANIDQEPKTPDLDNIGEDWLKQNDPTLQSDNNETKVDTPKINLNEDQTKRLNSIPKPSKVTPPETSAAPTTDVDTANSGAADSNVGETDTGFNFDEADFDF